MHTHLKANTSHLQGTTRQQLSTVAETVRTPRLLACSRGTPAPPIKQTNQPSQTPHHQRNYYGKGAQKSITPRSIHAPTVLHLAYSPRPNNVRRTPQLMLRPQPPRAQPPCIAPRYCQPCRQGQRSCPTATTAPLCASPRHVESHLTERLVRDECCLDDHTSAAGRGVLCGAQSATCQQAVEPS